MSRILGGTKKNVTNSKTKNRERKKNKKTKLVLIHVTSNFKISKNNVEYLSLDTLC